MLAWFVVDRLLIVLHECVLSFRVFLLVTRLFGCVVLVFCFCLKFVLFIMIWLVVYDLLLGCVGYVVFICLLGLVDCDDWFIC